MRENEDNNNDLLTIVEAAQLLRLSRHTIQAWLAPSSPIHRPEFAGMAKRAGRKILLRRGDLLNWLEQRPNNSDPLAGTEVSAYWFEKFVAARGLLKGTIRANVTARKSSLHGFRNGGLGLDAGPLLAWLADTPEASRVMHIIQRADYLVLPNNVAAFFLFQLRNLPKLQIELSEFFFRLSIFVVADITEETLLLAIKYADDVPEPVALACAASVQAGARAFASWDGALHTAPGVPVVSP